MKVLANCLVVYVPIATLAVFLFWVSVVKGPLEFATTLYWVAASAIGASLILSPPFASGSYQPLRKQQALFAIVGLVLLAAIALYVSFGFNDL